MKRKDNPEYLNDIYPEIALMFETTVLHDALTRICSFKADANDELESPEITIHFELGYLADIQPLSVPEGQPQTWFMDRLPLGKAFRKADMIQVICTVRNIDSGEPCISPFVVEAEHPAMLVAKIRRWIFKTLGIRINPLPYFEDDIADEN